MERVKFTGQARHVVDQRPGEFSEDAYLGQKLVNMMMYSGSRRIPRDVIMLLDHDTLQRTMQEHAREQHLTVEVNLEVETGDYIVRWWPTDGEVAL